jgi:hypothetical protein
MSSRGVAPIALILSITITVIGITLLFVFVGDKTGVAKNTYCKSIYRAQTLYGYRDRYCDDINRLAVSTAYDEKQTLNTFVSDKPAESLTFTRTDHQENAVFALPKNSELINASVSLSMPTNLFKTNFSDGTIYKMFLFTSPGQSQVVEFNIPRNAKILSSKFEISGESIPSLVDMVFVIDTSGSMSNEWHVLCTNLDILQAALKEINVDANFYIYRISTGGTYSPCWDGIITDSQMAAQLGGIPFTTKSTWQCDKPKEKLPNCKSQLISNPEDVYTEAWALATLWVINSFGQWRQNSKRIVFPISDSDPTGGMRTRYDPDAPDPHYVGEAAFSGNENAVIQRVKQQASSAGVSVFPIYGDRGKLERLTEGFNVGTEPAECYGKYSSTCGQILRWMHDLAISTGGNVSGYKDLNHLKKSIVNSVLLPFPEGVRVRVGSYAWQYGSELNDSTSPQIIREPELAQEIQSIVDSCTTTVCRVPIEITSYTPGAVLIDKLRINYFQELNHVDTALDGVGISTVQSLTVDNPSEKLDITEHLNNSLQNCQSELCEFTLTVGSSSEGVMLVKNLEVTYRGYLIEEALLQKITDCWLKNGYGRASRDNTCEEFIIPRDYIFARSISEASVTELMKKRELCHLIANKDHGCGTKDNLRFAKDINSPENVLIEYKAKPARIEVS